MDNRLYEPVDYHEIRSSSYNDRSNCVKEISSSSRLSETRKQNFLETRKDLLINSTVQTIPVTVSKNNEARCLERILINEETLNKIIVPIAGTESGTKSAERIRDRLVNRRDEIAAVNNYTSKKIRDQIEKDIKKDNSSTKNVFVKTKRIIFGPFRRSEDRPSSRKQSDSSVDGRLSRSSKSKSKSRSASPKLGRQDALLRVSLSLPWPLRSTSKEDEIPSEAESRRSSGSKVEDATTIQEENSPCEENVDNKKLNKQPSNKELPFIDVDEENIHQSDTEPVTAPINACSIGHTSARISEQLEKSKVMIERDQNISRIRGEFKYNQTDDGERDKVKCSQVQLGSKRDTGTNHSQKQEEGWQEKVKFDRRQNEAKQRDENHARCDAVPSDLMHKLRILSDAAAKREGRTTTAESSVVSSLESRSSRIRRAKESFLSRRGGPFCRSMMEPAEATAEDPWRRTSTTQISTTTETSKLNEIVATASSLEKPEDARNQTEMMTLVTENEIVNGNKVDAQEDRAIDVRLDSLVKSASAGMINVDPDTFDRLVTVDRGCESLPRAIAKRRDSSSPLAKIVGKLKFSRLIRTRNDGGMSTITTLCRQSLLIDMRNNPENRRSNEQQIRNDPIEDDSDDDHSDDSSKTIHE